MYDVVLYEVQQNKEGQMKRKILFTCVAGALSLALILGGCSKKTASSTVGGKKSGTLTIWSTMSQPERVKSFEDLAAAYTAVNPDVKITIEIMPWTGTMDKVMASHMAGNPPDITIMGSGWPQTLGAAGAIIETSDLIDSIGGKDKFLDMAISLGAYEDGIYSIPLYVTPYVTLYRKSYLEKAGIKKLPETWEEFYDMCVAVTDKSKNIYGFGAPMADVHSWKTIWVFLQSNDIDLVNLDKNGEWVLDVSDLDRQRIIEVYAYLYKLFRDASPEGMIGYTQEQVRELVANGTLMSRIDTPEIFYDLKAKGDAAGFADVGYFSFPGRVRIGSGTGAVTMGITSKGNVELAKDFVKFIYEGDRMVDFYASYPYAMYPVKVDMYHSAEYKAKLPDELKPMMPDMALEILSHATPLMMGNGPFPYSGEVESRGIFAVPLANMFTKGISATQAADQLIAEVKALLQ
jgi:ABC-type glycerol-3-phosphate transport system substrate-binding protein